jgi:hypothetical protein
MKISLSLPEAESYGRETLSKIRMSLSADDVVVGSYVPLGGGRAVVRSGRAPHGCAKLHRRRASSPLSLRTRTRAVLKSEITMSELNGDKARFQRLRKAGLRRR